MSLPDQPSRGRGTFLAALMVLLVAAGALTLLFAACGGFTIYAFAVIGGLILAGSVHYFFWGHSLGREVAGEREEDEIKKRLEADYGPYEERL